jgi:hypothetical protein
VEGTVTNADGNFSTLAASIPVSSLDSSEISHLTVK